MRSYCTEESESELTQEHGDNPDQEVIYIELDGETVEATREGGTLRVKEGATAIKPKVSRKRHKVICSCGWATCPMIGLYGHPEPTYKSEIKPLPTQSLRDMRAMSLKAEGN